MAQRPKKLLDQVRDALRLKHYAYSTEKTYISTLQDSLHVAGCCCTVVPQEDAPLQHNRSPRTTGTLLRGLLAVTTVGLSPTSR